MPRLTTWAFIISKMKLITILVMCVLMVQLVAAESIFTNKRPNGFYCTENSQCTSGLCVNSNCAGSTESRGVSIGGLTALEFVKQNKVIISTAVLVIGGIMILLYLKQRKVIFK